MTSADGSKPYNMTCTNGITYYEGFVYKVSTNAMVIIDAKGDSAVAVCDVSTVDNEQTARATVTGEKIGFFPLGCGSIVYVASTLTQTWAVGAIVYLDDTVNGMVTTSASTSRPIGHYMGDGETTSGTDGDLIPVILNVRMSEATA